MELPPRNEALGEGGSGLLLPTRQAQPDGVRNGEGGVEGLIKILRATLPAASPETEGASNQVDDVVDRLRLARRLHGHWTPSVQKIPALRKVGFNIKGVILSGIKEPSECAYVPPASPCSLNDLADLEASFYLASSDGLHTQTRTDLELQTQRAWRLALHYLGFLREANLQDEPEVFAASLHFAASFGRLARQISRQSGDDLGTKSLRQATSWLDQHMEAHALRHFVLAESSRSVDLSSPIVLFLRSMVSRQDDRLLLKRAVKSLRMLYSHKNDALDIRALTRLWKDAANHARPSSELVLLLAHKLPRLLSSCADNAEGSALRKTWTTCLTRTHQTAIRSLGALKTDDPRRRDQLLRLRALTVLLRKAGFHNVALLDHIALHVATQLAASAQDTAQLLDDATSALETAHRPDPYLVSSVVKSTLALPATLEKRRLEERLVVFSRSSLAVAGRDFGHVPKIKPGMSQRERIGNRIAIAQALVARIKDSVRERRGDAVQLGRELISMGWREEDPSAGLYGGAAERHALRLRQREGLSVLMGSHSSHAQHQLLPLFETALLHDPQMIPTSLPDRLIDLALRGSAPVWHGSSGLGRVLDSITAWHRSRQLQDLSCLPFRQTVLWRLGRKASIDQVLRAHGRLLRAVMDPGDRSIDVPDHATEAAKRIGALVSLLNAESGPREWSAGEVFKALYLAVSSAGTPSWLNDPRVWRAVATTIDEACLKKEELAVSPLKSVSELSGSFKALREVAFESVSTITDRSSEPLSHSASAACTSSR